MNTTADIEASFGSRRRRPLGQQLERLCQRVLVGERLILAKAGSGPKQDTLEIDGRRIG